MLDVERVFVIASKFASSNPLNAPTQFDGKLTLAHPT
jgi:hypothetical protein